MPTTPLTDAINALTTYSNTVTGQSDQTLSEAVATLAAGYGGGLSIDDFATGAQPSGAVILNTATSIGAYAFYHRTSVTSISAPECITINAYAFNGCSGLTSILFPAVTTFNGTYIFADCTNITEVSFPSLTSATNARLFHNCTKLATADLGECFKIDGQCFASTTLLRTLILRNDAVVSMPGWNATNMGGIYSNPTASTIYVPSALISSYQTAANWSDGYAAGLTFSAIEGSIYE